MAAAPDRLAERFEALRPRLRAVAYRLLGSVAEAEDAVQESWLRLGRADADAIEDLEAWLRTVVARQALNQLRARRARPEAALDERLPEPVVDREDGTDPEHEALLADGVGVALLVVLETLPPAERLAFVLHDVFAVPFDEVARVVDRSPDATRQLASRARRRVRGERTAPDVAVPAQRAVVDAFVRAARGGDLAGLVAVLDPDVVLRVDEGAGALRTLEGAGPVSRSAAHFAARRLDVRPAVVNGVAGTVTRLDGEVVAVGAFTVAGGRVVRLDILADPGRLAALGDLP